MNLKHKKHPPLLPGKLFTSSTVIIAAVGAIAVAVYLNTLPNGFIWDDNTQILKNPWVTDLRYIPEILSSSSLAFMKESSYTYRPLVFLVFMAEHYIFGFQTWGWHLTNIILHSINSIMVFLVARALLKQSAVDLPAPQNNMASHRNWNLIPGPHSTLFPFIAAVLFALHPVNTETVAWVACMVGLLYTFFFLLSFYLYMSADSGTARTRITYLALSVVSFFIATLSKETAIILFIILPVYDYTKRRLEYQRLKRYIPYLAAVGLYMILRSNAMGGLVEREAFLPNPFIRFLNVFPIFTEYLFKLLFPVHLSIFNVPELVSSVLDPRLFLSLIITVALFVFIWRLGRHVRSVLIPCFFIVVPLLPTFYTLTQNTDLYAIAILSERYLYLPSAGFTISMSLGLQWISGKPGGRRVIPLLLLTTLIIAGLYAFRTIKRNPVWTDEYTLWTKTVEDEPNNHFARFYLAINIYKEMGHNKKALAELIESIKIRPSFPGSHSELGILYQSMGQPAKAEREFRTALATDPENIGIHHKLGILYRSMEQPDKAERVLSAALAIDPENSGTHHMLGLLYYSMEQPGKAEKEFRTVLTAEPENSDAHYNIALIYMDAGRWDNAIQELNRALLYAGEERIPAIRNGLAVSYARIGRIEEAGNQLRMALDADPGDEETLRNLRSLERPSY